MYDELVKLLREEAPKALSNFDFDFVEDWIKVEGLIKEAADAIEELSKRVEESISKDDAEIIIAEVAKPRWIPVTERLPESKKETYWVCTDTGYQCECRWTNNMYGLGISDSWGWSIMDVPQYQKVVAWRDLPKSYEPQKEEIK